MSKAVLVSIKPEWVEKILNGEKTIEIRKTMPKCKLPCKVYIYCTKGQELWGDGTGNTWYGIDEDEDMERVFELTPTLARLNGKVVAEFTLRTLTKFDYLGVFYDYKKEELLKKSCLTEKQLADYVNPVGYAWHIDDLKIYDRPKELCEFYSLSSSKCKFREQGYSLWSGHRYYKCTLQNCMCDMKRRRILDCECFESTSNSHKLTKAPQSWCYVE